MHNKTKQKVFLKLIVVAKENTAKFSGKIKSLWVGAPKSFFSENKRPDYWKSLSFCLKLDAGFLMAELV